MAEIRLAEDTRVAWTLFAAALATVLASSPMFRARFRQAIATAQPPVRVPPVPVMLGLEAVKIALFSALAVWAGVRCATRAGLDAPLLRALLGHDPRAALAALTHALWVGPLLGLAAFALAQALRRVVGNPRPERDDLPTATRLTGLFYSAICIELWFHWGVLSLATRGFLAAGLPPVPAFAGGTAIATLAYSAFAGLTVRRTHPGVTRRRIRTLALVGLGVPSVLCALACFTSGLESAMFAQAVSTALALVAMRPRA